MEVKTNKMGSSSVKKLLIVMGIPMIISMALQALYNIIDTAFVASMPNGYVAKAAIAALGYAFPVQMLMVSVAIGTGVGANALLSKSLGQCDGDKVGKTAGNALFLGGIIYAVFLLFGLFGARPFANAMAGGSQIIADMTAEYLLICCTCSFALVFFGVYEKILQSTGKTLFSTIAQVSGAVTNIILDPIFIYGIGAMPELGIAGAAWATVTGQAVSFIVAAGLHYGLNKEVPNGIKFLRPQGKIILEIYKIGLPAILAQALMSFMTMGMNLVLGIPDNRLIEEGLASADAPPYVGAYSVFYKIQQFVLFLAFGMRDAITPVISYNYGMKSKKRITQGIKYGLLYTVALMAAGLILLEAIPAPLAGIFDDGLSDLAMKFCINAMRIIAASFIFAGINITLQGIFQALGSGLASLIISVCRQLLFVIPIALGFAYIALAAPADYDWLMWLTFIISEGVSLIIAVFMLRSVYTKKVASITEDNV